MKLSEDLVWRGLIKDKTFADLSWLDEPKTFYLGSDASFGSLTIGNLAIYMLARRLRKYGWKAVLLLGGATSLIGDPGGKEAERDLRSREEIVTNVKVIETQVKQLFSGMDFKLVDNYDWFKDVGYLEFLREIGKNYSITELLQRDFIAQRIGEGGSGISYAEFSYSLIQGYDYWHLYKHHNVVLQIGGSDQWGNMLSGVPLIRKKENVEVHALSMPLVVNKTTGQKFGKSEGGAVWLDAELTPPAELFQFWLNVDDESVLDYLKIYTMLSQSEVEELSCEMKRDPGERTAQKRLAYEVTTLVHGEAHARAAEDYAKSLIDRVEPLARLKASAGDGLVELLLASGLVSSKTEGRQLLAARGIYINNRPATKSVIEQSDFVNGTLKLRRGKKLKNTVFFVLK